MMARLRFSRSLRRGCGPHAVTRTLSTVQLPRVEPPHPRHSLLFVFRTLQYLNLAASQKSDFRSQVFSSSSSVDFVSSLHIASYGIVISHIFKFNIYLYIKVTKFIGYL